MLGSLPLRSTLTASAQGGKFPTTFSDGYEFGKGGYHIDLPVNKDAPLSQAQQDEGRAATYTALSSAVRVCVFRMSEFGRTTSFRAQPPLYAFSPELTHPQNTDSVRGPSI